MFPYCHRNASYILYLRRFRLGNYRLPNLNDRSKAFQRDYANDVDSICSIRYLLHRFKCLANFTSKIPLSKTSS